MELAELTQDPDFRAAVRRMAQYQAAERAQGDVTGSHHDLTETVRDSVGRALDAGIAPASAEAAPIIDALTARYAQTFSRADDADLRHWLLTRLEIAGDPRAERYWHLLAVINGWPVVLGGKVVERQQLVDVVGDLLHRLGELIKSAEIGGSERLVMVVRSPSSCPVYGKHKVVALIGRRHLKAIPYNVLLADGGTPTFTVR